MCITPYYKYSEPNTPLPCGKCPHCLRNRINQWSFRLSREERVSTTALFMTFTYDCESAPRTPNGFLTLSKVDFQSFMKRYRKLMNPMDKPVKYYAVGEYGSRTMRPHYHAIMFNADYNLIEKAWIKGHIYGGTVTDASVQYTLKYINKKGKIPMHANDDRMKEFSLMSKRLGMAYLTFNMFQWHRADPFNRMYVNGPNKTKVAMPRYYKERIFDKTEILQFAEYVKNLTIEKNNISQETYMDRENKKQDIISAFNNMHRNNDAINKNRI